MRRARDSPVGCGGLRAVLGLQLCTELQREAAATVLQASARSRGVRRRRTVEARRGTSVWSGLRSRFVAALGVQGIEEQAEKASGQHQTKSKSDW